MDGPGENNGISRPRASSAGVVVLGLAGTFLTAGTTAAQETLDGTSRLAPSSASTLPEPWADPWWEVLEDPTLTDLLRRAAEANGDITAAVARIRQAEGVAVQSRASLLPTVSLDGQTNAGPLNGLGFQFGGIPRGDGSPQSLPDRFYSGSANATLRYRLTSWGSEYRALQASRLDAMASRGDADGVVLGLLGQVAEAYFDAVSASEQVDILEGQLEVGRQLAELTQLRYEQGEATALEVFQQRQQYATTQANLPPVRAEHRSSVARLEALVGLLPGGGQFSLPRSLPDLPGQPSVSMTFSTGTEPSGFFDRPDIRGADARLDAAGFRAARARWDLLPTVDFSANVGSQFFRSLDTRSQSNWGAALTVSIPLIDGLARSGRRQETGEGRRAARASAEQLRRTAAFEMASADVIQQEQRAQLEALEEQVTWSERAFQESRRRYVAGLASFLDVLTALNGLQQAQLGVVRTRRGALAAWIQLRQSAGGPWTQGLRRRLLEGS